METITLQYRDQSLNIHFSLIRSKRKTISIIMDPLKGMIVRAPKRMTKKTITDFIHSKTKWIMQKHSEQKQVALPPDHNFQDGDTFKIHGDNLSLQIIQKKQEGRKKSQIYVNQQSLVLEHDPSIALDKNKVKTYLKKWYQQLAQDYFTQRIEYFCQNHHGIRRPETINTRNYKSRWGTCSTDKAGKQTTITLNWRLMMAPLEIIDYVIVHELAHTKHMNHSKKYWDLVSDILPDYKISKKWLKKHGITLQF